MTLPVMLNKAHFPFCHAERSAASTLDSSLPLGMTRKKAFGMTEKAHGMFCAVMLNEAQHPPPHPVSALPKHPSPSQRSGTSAKQTE